MSSPASLEPGRTALLADLSLRLGDVVTDLAALDAALRHRSWCGENGGVTSNERLEFLGDAVLQLVITERLYRGEPALPEGVLAQRRSALVNTRALADAARRVDLGPAIRLGRGEAATGGNDKDSILADATEAVIGAVYLEGGFEVARDVVVSLLLDDIIRVESGLDPGDPKSRLQERAAHELELVPSYEVDGAGPDHAREFSATVVLGDAVWGRGEGRTKKEAEQAAAAAALRRLVDEGKLTDEHR
ncbi:MAG TPA: ribonuclease III [Microthrixaceae bacterium]|nr:ribonuclease III [Microthrixaceae bacterium]HNI34738.1 ribonuclease III [Microthrixaceae bacterium]